jgi:hypothetical protein
MSEPLTCAVAELLAGGDPAAWDAALARRAAAVSGPDWREQSWDSYRADLFDLEAWCVALPFAALTAAGTPVVPLTAAERLLALPDQPPEHPWSRPIPGRAYRPYWKADKRFLALVADLAARWPADSAHLVRALRRSLRGLNPRDRDAVALHCASLGLTGEDPGDLARRVLASAEADELGARGELIHHALARVEALPEGDQAAILARATAAARRTTAFVASNPFAACVEALAETEGAGVSELIELIERAARVKMLDWQGWEQALMAAGRAVTALAARHGAEPVNHVIAELKRWQRWLPGLEPWLLLCGSRGLSGVAAAHAARRAVLAARRGAPSVLGLRAEAAAGRRLLDLGAERAAGELRATLERLVETPPGRAQQAGLQAAVSAVAPLDWPLAKAAARGLRDHEPRWLALMTLAVTPGEPGDCIAALAAARRCARWWLLRRPPLDVLAPLAQTLAESLPGGPAHPAVAQLVELATIAAAREDAGPRYAARLMALAEPLSAPEALPVLAGAVPQGGTWWELPLLAVLGDAAEAWLARVSPPVAAQTR